VGNQTFLLLALYRQPIYPSGNEQLKSKSFIITGFKDPRLILPFNHFYLFNMGLLCTAPTGFVKITNSNGKTVHRKNLAAREYSNTANWLQGTCCQGAYFYFR
jgi:hypothetical protein